MTIRFTTGLLLLAAGPLGAHAQPVHDADYAVRLNSGALETGAYDPALGEVVYPILIKSAEFGAEGFPNFTNDPGVNSAPGALEPDLGIGFDLEGPLLEWDGSGFNEPAPFPLRVRDGFDQADTPMSDVTVPGFLFGFAGSDTQAIFHSHVQFLLDPDGGAGAHDGMWLLKWRLWGEDALGIAVAPTPVLYVVFAQGSAALLIEDGVLWVEENLLDAGCAPDVNADGVLDNGDIAAFVGLFLASDLGADFTGDGLLDNGDISAFVQAFLAGC
ncbi:MAG: GC-type dockerin domain-anchored protein [Phycisphaerales bacterium JB040]